MRNATLKDLGIRYYYWLMALGFGVVGIVSFSAVRTEPESSLILIGFGIFFCAIAGLACLWPIFRIREQQGPSLTTVRSEGSSYHGVLIPASRVKSYISVIGGSVLGIAALLAAIFADGMEHRVKGGIAFVVYICLGVGWLKGAIRHTQGILLTKGGILWHQPLKAPCFIPWEEIRNATDYRHPNKYSRPLSFGLAVKNIDNLALNTTSKRKLTEDFNRFGVHLYYYGESLLVPTDMIARVIRFYLVHPELRNELSNGSALNLFENMSVSPV